MSLFFGTRWLTVLALTALLSVQPAFAKQTITTTVLGNLGGNWSEANDVNNRGQAVGYSLTSTGDRHAFVWLDGVMTDIDTLSGSNSEAFGINDRGLVVGTRGSLAFIWKDGAMTDLGTLGGANSMAYDINNKGQVVGSSETSDGVVHAFIWQDGMMTDLGTLGGTNSVAFSINDSGQVVGYSLTSTGDDNRHAFIWQNGVMTDIGSFDGGRSVAYGINDRGQVVGGSSNFVNPAYSNFIPFMWQGAEMTRIFNGIISDEGVVATAINNKGQVVGNETHALNAIAFILQNGLPTYLALKPDGSLPADSGANSINDHCQVAGFTDEDFNSRQAVIWSIKGCENNSHSNADCPKGGSHHDPGRGEGHSDKYDCGKRPGDNYHGSHSYGEQRDHR